MAKRSPRSTLIKELELMLGGQMVEVELDNEHYDLSFDLALDRYYQRSSGALQEDIIFITFDGSQNEYTLGDEIQEVRQIHRRSVGTGTSGGVNFDPFESAFSNMYFLQSGRTGGLATWELFAEYQETVGRLFGSQISFIWNEPDRKLKILQKFDYPEMVMMTVFVRKSEDTLLNDSYARPWLRDYALAKCKAMLGEARGKFPSGLPGPSGSVMLNGDQLKQEAQLEMERLEEELLNFSASSDGFPFLIG